MQVKHIARVGFAARRTFEHERDLAIRHRVFGKIIKDNERVHAVIHKPLAHGGAGKRSQILVGSRVRRRRGNDGGVRHGAFLFQHGEGTGNVGIFLPDSDVNTIKRSIILQLPLFPGFIQAGLADDRVHRDRQFTGRAIADN